MGQSLSVQARIISLFLIIVHTVGDNEIVNTFRHATKNLATHITFTDLVFYQLYEPFLSTLNNNVVSLLMVLLSRNVFLRRSRTLMSQM